MSSTTHFEGSYFKGAGSAKMRYRGYSKEDNRFWREPLRRAVDNGTLYLEVSAEQDQQVQALVGKPIQHGTRYLLLMRGYHLMIRYEGRVPVLESAVHYRVEGKE